MSGHKVADISADVLVLGRGGSRAAAVAGAIGLASLGAAAALAPVSGGYGRFLLAWLVAFAFFTSLSLGALFFTMLQHATRAGWSVVVRRISEILGCCLVPLGVLSIPLLLGLGELFPWAHAAGGEHAEALRGKAAYLNVPFFVARTVFYFAVWALLAWWLLRTSRKQDETGDARATVRMEKLSALGILLFALTSTFFAFDWLMSLNPLWYSTIFGVYFFAGAILGFFALLPIVAVLLQRAGYARHAITHEHYHDMGKLVFAFVVFWAYIAFSQFMLMWYGNIPEETVWYLARQTGGWTNVSLVLLFGHFLLPFLALMSRFPKRRTGTLVAGAVWMLAMHWLDLFWLVMPGRTESAVPGLLDLLCFLGIGGVWAAVALFRAKSMPIVPVKDPRLPESLGFENV